MHKKRLLKLADLIERETATHPNLKFNMGEWGRTDMDPEVDSGMPACKTAACAMGVAALSGAFKRQGLHGQWIKEDSFLGDRAHWWLDITFADKQRQRHAYNALHSAMMLFDIEHEETTYLFLPDNYPQRKRKAEHVVARIRRFVEHGGIPS